MRRAGPGEILVKVIASNAVWLWNDADRSYWRIIRVEAPAFKAKIVLVAVRGEKTLTELAQQFDVHPNQIRQWRDQLLEGSGVPQGGDAFRLIGIGHAHIPGPPVRTTAKRAAFAYIDEAVVDATIAEERNDAVGDVALGDAVQRQRHAAMGKRDHTSRVCRSRSSKA